MLGLAEALHVRGHRVEYAAIAPNSSERDGLGWPSYDEIGFKLHLIPTRAAAISLARSKPANTIHIMQGIRGQAVLSTALRYLGKRHADVWCLLECIDERSPIAGLKRLIYRTLLSQHRRKGTHFLAIGAGMKEWLIQRGAEENRVYGFAYFLTQGEDDSPSVANQRIQFGFVGRHIGLKRIDLLIAALKQLDSLDFDVSIFGAGPLSGAIRRSFDAFVAPDRLHWHGVVPMAEVRRAMARLDCLILPSDYDGWGAVVSEALIAGTPVIVSDQCGAAAAVVSPDMGSVFSHGNVAELEDRLRDVVAAGPVSPTRRLRVRAIGKGLTADAGAAYLEALIEAVKSGKQPPELPWVALAKGQTRD